MAKYIVDLNSDTILDASECVVVEIDGDHDEDSILAKARQGVAVC